MPVLAYLVPEFPNQTHAFFWREVQALEAEGVTVLMLSTRRPAADACPHDFADEAHKRTHYLFPPPATAPARFLAARPARVAAALRYVAGLAESSGKDRLRVAAMLPSAAELCLAMRRAGARHLHVHSCANAAHLAALAHILDGVTYSLTLHGNLDVYGSDHAAKFARAQFVQAVTRPLRDEILQVSPKARVPVITMGVDTSRFRPVAQARREVPQFVSIARLNMTKGHVFFLRAMRQVLDQGHRLSYVIAGDGPARDMIQTEVAAQRLQAEVSFLGAISQDQVLQVLQGSDGFVLTSFGHGEAAPVAVMEAMAVGLPVICSEIGGTADMITDGVDGLLVAQQDVSAIAEALRKLVDDPALRRHIGEAARARAVAEFDARATARQLLGSLDL